MIQFSRPIRQVLAVALLGFLLLAMWTVVLQPMLALVSDRKADIEALSGQMIQLRTVIQRRPALEQRAQFASRRLAAEILFWSGPSRTAIAGLMQDLVHAAAIGAGGQVVSFSELGSSDESGFTKLSVRARVEGSIATMHAVLVALEAARPMLFVDTLTLSAMDIAPNPTHSPQIGMEIGFGGYLQSAHG